ncbi:hypothetical protein H8K55_09440 [Undibacterium sp. LX15W]|uniref:Bacteriocin biosynthesis cyclodehydratase domain-containing protein n=2 Tax=Undibacterium flavidum TaxID=2762297 RepID=A0ABR6YB60_9BURK|nr:hypothetical protein [Undibacterium flavidum]
MHNASKKVLSPILGSKIYKIDTDQWQVVTATSAQTIKCPEKLLQAVVDAFGKMTREEFITQMSERFDAKMIADFVDALVAREVICLSAKEESEEIKDRLFYLLPTISENKNQIVLNPSQHTLRLFGSGHLYAELNRMAKAAGFCVSGDQETETLPVSMNLVVSDSPNHDLFRELNREHVVPTKVASIFAYLDGSHSRIFRVIPSATACFECLHHRMRVAKTFHREFDAASSGNAIWYEDVLPEPIIQAQQLAATVLVQVSLMLVNAINDLHESNLIELLAFNDLKRKSSILKLPRCEVCGSGNTTKPFAPIYNPAAI